MDYVHQAKALNMLSLGFSSHAPVSFPTLWTMKPERLQEYITAIETIKKTVVGLEVYKGLEVDYIPEVTSPNLFNDVLDYTIGSIHFVEKLPDGTRWEIDGTHAFFLEGFSKIFNNNIRDTIRRYFELTREMISIACPTVIGHMDKIKIQNVDGKFFSETDSWYQEEVKETINLIQTSGAIVEVNTRGIYQKKSTTTYPSPWILEILHRKKIPITISSDAHRRDDIVNQFPETAALLKKIGFTSLSVLVDGKWQALPFNENGILR
jgi:histidinol-phosphatase (PHP family)